MKKVGVGVIGVGNIGFFHTRGLKMVNVYGDYEAELVALADTDAERGKYIGERFGFKRITTDYMDVINDPEVEVVSVLTPNCTHTEIAIAAAKAGKHVMVEKPLTMNKEETEEIVKAFEEAGVSSMVNFIYTTVPVNKEAKKLIGDGRIGDVTYFKGWFECSYKGDPDKELQWRDEKSKAATGVIGDVIAHIVSISDMIGGDTLGEIVAVCANRDTVYTKREDMDNGGREVDIDTDDICSVLVKYSTGRTGIMYATRLAPGHDNYFGYEIEGTKGTLAWSLNRINELQFYEKGEYETQGFKTILGNPTHGDYKTFNIYEESGVSYPELFAMHYQKFFKAIDEKKPIDIDIKYGAYVDKILFAMVKSCEENRWVKIDEI